MKEDVVQGHLGQRDRLQRHAPRLEQLEDRRESLGPVADGEANRPSLDARLVHETLAGQVAAELLD